MQGLSLTDVMFVTKRNMANAVQSMSKQLEQVSSALAVCFIPNSISCLLQHLLSLLIFKCNLFQATKRHLTQRLENLDGKMDEQVEVSKAIRNEVGSVEQCYSWFMSIIIMIFAWYSHGPPKRLSFGVPEHQCSFLLILCLHLIGTS